MLYIIVNPVSGKNIGLKMLEELKKQLDSNEVIYTVLLSQ